MRSDNAKKKSLNVCENEKFSYINNNIKHYHLSLYNEVHTNKI